MAKIPRSEIAPKGEVSYNTEALYGQMNEYGIKQRHVMAIFNQSNPCTINKWKNGSDIYIGALVAICNVFKLDPLRFFKYAGHTFRSNIEDLYRLELGGVTVADILDERGVDTYTDNKLKPARTEEEIAKEAERREVTDAKIIKQHNAYNQRKEAESISPMNTRLILELQKEAFAHEQKALDELRQQKDTQIAALQQTIVNLKMTLARLGYQGYIADGAANTAVADDSNPNQNAL